MAGTYTLDENTIQQMQLQIEEIREEVTHLSTNVSQLSTKVDIIVSAVVGNELTKDGGMAEKQKQLERDFLKLKERVEENEKNSLKEYKKVVVWFVGTVLTIIIGFTMASVLK